ncbi:flagellar hook-associated protein FlgK [Clostridium sp.]|jgi:flagellar hook-associated protein 1|uniref:flagellar hook-associated protein FlgK n=1 Tax=Clostridium sp. TaxID=1506 RepID=UPI0039F56E7D
MSGLFATFNIGKSGLFSQQQAINTTSHNIANANTEGYSRQRAIMETTRPYCMPSMNSASGPGQVGTGVDVAIIQRVRDTFMDFQVRNEKSTLGQYEARDKYLSEVEGVFNEPSDTGISNLIGEFFDAWEQVSKQPESSNTRTVLVTQASALADELNHTYNQLIEIKKNAQESIGQSVFDMNAILEKIDKLNQQIISVKVSGMEPNDLLDSRDLLLDELSERFNINVEQDDFYSINLRPTDESGQTDREDSLLVRKNPNDAVRRFSYIKSIEPENYDSGVSSYTITYYKNGDKDKTATITVTGIDSVDKFKQLDQCRILWSQKDDNNDIEDGLALNKNGEAIEDGASVDIKDLALFELKDDKFRGELKGYMSVQKDVDDYIEQLNKLAKAIAFSVNAIHSGVPNDGSDGKVDKDYTPFFVNSETTVYETTAAGKRVLYNGEIDNLSSALDHESEITAGNISINKQLMDDVMQIKTRTNDDKFATADLNSIDGEKDGNRALAIAQLRGTLLQIQNIGNETSRSDFIKELEFNIDLGLSTIKSDIKGMKIDNYFKDTIDKLGIQEQEAMRVVKNQETLLSSFQERRDSISGVSLDEEMANLIQYQHAYQANAKIITTVDELLDVVVNGLKR